METTVLREFVEFAKYLNFSAAARALHMSQSSLSKHIADLERDLGFNLIVHGNPPTLTKAGIAFLEVCEEVIFAFDVAVEHCRTLDRQPDGRIVIQDPVMDSTISNQSIPVFMYFAEHHPSVEIELFPLRGKTISDALNDGTMDVGYFMGYGDIRENVAKKAQAGIVAFPLRTRRFAVWMSKDHPVAKKEELHVEDMRDYPILVQADRLFDDWRLVLQNLCEAHGFTPKIKLRITPTINSYFALNTQNGFVILADAFLSDPRFLMRRDMVTRELVGEGCEYNLYCVYRADNRNPALPLFIEQLKQTSEFADQLDELKLLTRSIL